MVAINDASTSRCWEENTENRKKCQSKSNPLLIGPNHTRGLGPSNEKVRSFAIMKQNENTV